MNTELVIPCVYYGDEQDFKGGNDPANREDFWKTGYATDGATFQWVKKLLAIRKKFSAIQKGQQKVVWASTRTGGEPDAGIFAFERTGGDAAGAYALVVINTNVSHPSSPSFNGMPMKVSAGGGTTLVDVLAGAGSFTVQGDGGLVVSVPPTSAVILVPEDQANGN
jgi:alpha-amylase